MITLSDVTMNFGAQVLFEHATWQLAPGAHYGLVGANGTGKSTLLRLMTGQLKPESGRIAIPNSLRVGTLGQDHFHYDRERLVDAVIMGRPRLWEALREKQALLRRLNEAGAEDENPSSTLGHRMGELETVIADLGGYQAEAQAGTLLTGLGIPTERHERPMQELSGGYRLRVLLAQTLFAEPELLLLDEPTNHLDIVSIRWLEEYLRAFPGTFVVVSHDRHFLNRVCNHVVDLDYQELRLYPGDYDAFEGAKALATEQKEAEIARVEERIAEMQRFIVRFKAKATKARQAQSRKKQVERMEIPEIRRSSRRHPGLRFNQVRPSGKEVLRIHQVSKRYDQHTVLDNVGFSLERGEKLAVVGPNGVGKSTLLKLIHGSLTPEEGEILPGYEVHLGYFAQDHHEVLKGRASVYEWLHAQAPGESVGIIRGLLGQMLFSGEEVHKKLDALSGGEAARLLLAGLMLRRPNLLVLDEPTNHLDLEGREALMNALKTYEGTVIFVSHDRHFVSQVAIRILALSWDGVEDFVGSYEDYLARQGQDYLDAASATRPGWREDRTPPDAGAATGGYQQRKEHKKAVARLKREVSRLEQKVAELEQELATLEGQFADKDFYDRTPWEQIQQVQQQRQEKQHRLNNAIAAWERAASELETLQEAS